ncbi:VOC family protein [Shewanella olleyana]|uniref:VOC family protein n=1 Tax=Shewanella olleyana TaxID=135626 RepID=UPI00200E0F90|nr:VOC family protein [Shewanella olleyana]MCL1068343.1 VOC family protein [Shewanella olleyana]
MDYAQLLKSWPDFSQRITLFIKELGLDTLQLDCDHCALRVNSVDAAERLTTDFEQHGQVISNNMINGRPILIIKLNTPMELDGLKVPCVELPFPSDKLYPQEGWEHVELVLPTNATTCEQLIEDLLKVAPSAQNIIDGKTDIKVKLSSPKGDNERLANPTIAFKQNGICVKVHPQTIEAIIASEQ